MAPTGTWLLQCAAAGPVAGGRLLAKAATPQSGNPPAWLQNLPVPSLREQGPCRAVEEHLPSREEGGIASHGARPTLCNGVGKFAGMLWEAGEGTGAPAKAEQTLAQCCAAARTSPRDAQNGHPSTAALSPEEGTGLPPSVKQDRACKPQQRKALERS